MNANDNRQPILESEEVLKKVVELAHENNVKVLLSIGGFYGSLTFSTMAGKPKRRTEFIDQLRKYRDEFKLDGFDIDWEFPGRPGVSCNEVSEKNDADNLLKLVTEMRSSFPKKLITMTVSVHPFDGPDGIIKDVSEYAKKVNFINIMPYDIYGSWSKTTGPNAPFRWKANAEAPFSFRQSIDAWLKAKMPANKIVMGIPFYGRSLIAEVDMSADPKNMYVAKSGTVPQGDKNDATISESCPDSEPEFTGIWSYGNLRSQNILSEPKHPAYGWKRYWDETSQTPWLFNVDDKKFISYDDVQSIEVKVKYTQEKGLRGLMIWSLDQDNGELIEVLQPFRN